MYLCLQLLSHFLSLSPSLISFMYLCLQLLSHFLSLSPALITFSISVSFSYLFFYLCLLLLSLLCISVYFSYLFFYFSLLYRPKEKNSLFTNSTSKIQICFFSGSIPDPHYRGRIRPRYDFNTDPQACILVLLIVATPMLLLLDGSVLRVA